MTIISSVRSADSVLQIRSLLAKYELKLSLGDQDYLTVLGWEDPHLFHILDCR